MVTIRPATVNDVPFLERMLVAAADWRPNSTQRSVEEVLAEPALAHYVVGWPEPGEFGVIADDGQGRSVGAAWCRLLPEGDPGFGFVDEDVPEVSLGVVAEARGRGIGRMLMEALVEQARSNGVARVSLSVETDNHAMGLYENLGFVVVARGQGAATMVLDVT